MNIQDLINESVETATQAHEEYKMNSTMSDAVMTATTHHLIEGSIRILNKIAVETANPLKKDIALYLVDNYPAFGGDIERILDCLRDDWESYDEEREGYGSREAWLEEALSDDYGNTIFLANDLISSEWTERMAKEHNWTVDQYGSYVEYTDQAAEEALKEPRIELVGPNHPTPQQRRESDLASEINRLKKEDVQMTTLKINDMNLRKPTGPQILVYEAINTGVPFDQLPNVLGMEMKKVLTIVNQLTLRGNLAMSVSCLGMEIISDEEKKAKAKEKAREYRNRPEVKARAKAKKKQKENDAIASRNLKAEQERIRQAQIDPANPKGRSEEEMAERLAARKARKEERRANKKANKKAVNTSTESLEGSSVEAVCVEEVQTPGVEQTPVQEAVLSPEELIALAVEKGKADANELMLTNKRKYTENYRELLNSLITADGAYQMLQQKGSAFATSKVEKEAKQKLIMADKGKAFFAAIEVELGKDFYSPCLLALMPTLTPALIPTAMSAVMLTALDGVIHRAFESLKEEGHDGDREDDLAAAICAQALAEASKKQEEFERNHSSEEKQAIREEICEKEFGEQEGFDKEVFCLALQEATGYPLDHVRVAVDGMLQQISVETVWNTIVADGYEATAKLLAEMIQPVEEETEEVQEEESFTKRDFVHGDMVADYILDELKEGHFDYDIKVEVADNLKRYGDLEDKGDNEMVADSCMDYYIRDAVKGHVVEILEETYSENTIEEHDEVVDAIVEEILEEELAKVYAGVKRRVVKFIKELKA